MSVLGDKKKPQGTFDADLEFKDAGLVDTSGAAQVDNSDQVVDIGTGLFKGCMIVDVSALEIASNDEIYDIVVQLSSDDDFGTPGNIVEAAQLSLSCSEEKRTDCDADDSTGRYKIYFDNEFDGTYYRYARLYTVVGGSINDGINYSAFCVPMY